MSLQTSNFLLPLSIGLLIFSSEDASAPVAQRSREEIVGLGNILPDVDMWQSIFRCLALT